MAKKEVTKKDKKILKGIEEAVEDGFEEQVDFLSDLVQTKSVNPYTSGESPEDESIEEEVAKQIYEKLEEFELSPRRKGASEKRQNIVCWWGYKRARKILMLNGHMDTIAPSEDIVLDPFSGARRSGRLYGLGVLDMKASLTAYMWALRAVLEQEVEPERGRLALAFVVDGKSSSSSKWGTHYLLEHGVDAKTAIIGRRGLDRIGVGNRGVYRFKITVEGERVGTGTDAWEKREKGHNAAVDMAKVIEVLQDIEIPYKTGKVFENRKPVFTFPTKIKSGRQADMVPDKAEAWGDVRLMPGNSDRQIKMLIEDKLDELRVKSELEDLLFVPSVEIDKKDEIVLTLGEEAEKVLGEKPDLEGMGSWNEAWMLKKRDIPTITSFGPEGKLIPGKREYVELDSLKDVTKIYARVIYRYLIQ